MPATAWDLFCSAWFSVFSHWPTANSSFGHRSCSLSGWQCLVVLLCSARSIFLVGLSQASAFLWPAMWPALRYRAPNNALLMPNSNMEMRDRRGTGDAGQEMRCAHSRKIAIKARGSIVLVDPREVVSIHAEGNYVLLKRESGSYLLTESILDMVSKLGAYGFVRIHRSRCRVAHLFRRSGSPSQRNSHRTHRRPRGHEVRRLAALARGIRQAVRG